MLFRELYVRYFYKLHTPCDKHGSILHLAILFENLVKQKDIDVFYYLVHDLDIQPLEIAFKWLMYAFVGILDNEQLLLMWDRIIAYDSLDLLAISAAALFNFRKPQLMLCQNREEASVIVY